MSLLPCAATIERFAELAQMECIEGQKAFELSQTLQLIRQADTAGIEAMRNTEQVEARIEQSRKMINLVTAVIPLDGFDPLSQQRAISHTDEDGRKTVVIYTSQDKTVTIHLVMMLRSPLDLKLHIYPEWFGSRVGKFLFRMQDIQLGDPNLDPLVMVKAEDVAGATRLLTGQKVQAELKALYTAKEHHPVTVINDISARVSLSSKLTAEKLLWWHERLAALESVLHSRH